MANQTALDEYLQSFRTWLQDADFTPSDYVGNESWSGTIVVDWLDATLGQINTREHHVRIVLPEGFPYNAPTVVSEDEPSLEPSWHFMPGSVPTLCLWGSQNGWQPHFTAQRLLRRIHEWFGCYHTGNWPSNSEFPDLHLYLECIGVVVVGDNWNPPQDTDHGQCCILRPETISQWQPCFAIHGTKPDANIFDNHLVKSLLITQKDYSCVPGLWFRLTSPIVPPRNLHDLLKLIEKDLSQPEGWAGKLCVAALATKPRGDGFPIALGYRDYSSQERWLFLWVKLGDNPRERHKIHWSNALLLSRIALVSLQTAPARNQDLLRRTEYISQHLVSRKVLIFGVGSLGSSTALLLAKAGFGEIRLVDHDVILPGNVIRHAAGLQWTGLPKTLVLERVIAQHNPGCKVSRFESTWNKEKLVSYIEDCDLVLDTTANRKFSLYLNEICVEQEKPTIFAATYRRATIGRILIYRGPQDTCLSCYVDASKNWSSNDYPIIPSLDSEQFIEDGCGVVIEEAVALDVEVIANLTSRIAIKLVRGQLDSSNLVIHVNEPVVGVTNALSQAGTHWLTNHPLEGCAICRN